jgi:hypothetical protein
MQQHRGLPGSAGVARVLKRRIETPCRSGNERDRLGLGLRRSGKEKRELKTSAINGKTWRMPRNTSVAVHTSQASSNEHPATPACVQGDATNWS